jgi:hypothetical protein
MDKNNKSIGFRLAKIATEQFAIIESNFEKKAKIHIQIQFRFAADDKHRLVGVFFKACFETEKKQFLLIEAACHFEITPENWVNMMNQEQNKLTVPKNIMQHLAMLTTGTTRGILHAKTENTCFNQYYLPTINVSKIINQDNVFEFK